MDMPRLPPEIWALIIEGLPRISDVAALGVALPGVLLRPLVDEICVRPMVRAPNRLLTSGAPLPVVRRLLAYWNTNVNVMTLRTAVVGGQLDVLAWLVDLVVWPGQGVSPGRDVSVTGGVRYTTTSNYVDIQALGYAIVCAVSTDCADMVLLLLGALDRYPDGRAKRRALVRAMKAAVEREHSPSIDALYAYVRRDPWHARECLREIGSHAIRHNKVKALQWMYARDCRVVLSPPRVVECALLHNAAEALVWAANLLWDPLWRIHSKCVIKALARGDCSKALERARALGLVDTGAPFARGAWGLERLWPL
jgi:hypothetical protein